MFRDLPEPPQAQPTDAPAEAPQSIGALMGGANALSADKVEKILAYQQQHKVRFGEAAVALGLASEDDVVRALATQFQYPLTPSQPHGVSPEVVVAHRPFSPQAEVFRGIRAQLMLRLHGPQMPPRAIAVVSHDSGDGRSYFAANIAAAFGQIGGRTLLIDADLRNSRQHKLFKIENHMGLSSLLAGRMQEQVVTFVHGIPGLAVLPAGPTPPNPAELLSRPAFERILMQSMSTFDVVLIDTPAFESGADATMLARITGASLAIARTNLTRTSAFNDLVTSLENAGTHVVGSVLVDVPPGTRVR